MRFATVSERARVALTREELLAWYGPEEEIISPEIPIIDAHHHFRDRPPQSYLFEEFQEDITNSGHNVRATVFVECTAMYRANGLEHLKPLGEVEFVNGIAARSASGLYGNLRMCAGIVGFADLTLGAAVEDLLVAQLNAGGGRFRGIRNRAQREQSITWAPQAAKDLLLRNDFRSGFQRLAQFGLTYDSWQYFVQISDLANLARAFPATTIIMNHLGGIVGVGGYEGCEKEVFQAWRASLHEIASCPNVVVKLGGLGMLSCGFPYHLSEQGPTSDQLAKQWLPYVEECINAFGVRRCMFEGNFPPDRQSCSYRTLWNAFKRIVLTYSADEKAALFFETANDVYKLALKCPR